MVSMVSIRFRRALDTFCRALNPLSIGFRNATVLLCSLSFSLPKRHPFPRGRPFNGRVVPSAFPALVTAFLGLSITSDVPPPSAWSLDSWPCFFYPATSILSSLLLHLEALFLHPARNPAPRRTHNVKAKHRASTQEAVSPAGLYRPRSGSGLCTLQVCPIPCRPSIPARAPALPMLEDDDDKLSPINTPPHSFT
ncbi:hypothetical protein B0H15DRAFT_839549 [Mycena belliarum]|uniref:Uncharacterized protein n=1 Tax=Mycena belliarum TaxID=1033014 RepID=A0AAD6U5X6_9AGAR|nr:hypothetical protein B0H15DRAFT_839549 [Mycena belliae]